MIKTKEQELKPLVTIVKTSRCTICNGQCPAGPLREGGYCG